MIAVVPNSPNTSMLYCMEDNTWVGAKADQLPEAGGQYKMGQRLRSRAVNLAKLTTASLLSLSNFIPWDNLIDCTKIHNCK